MTTHRKLTACEELERIEKALVESLLNANEHDLREELTSAGKDPDSCVADIDATIAQARVECALSRMETARAELAAWRGRGMKPGRVDLEETRAQLQRLRSGDAALDSKMMMAARKGEGLSESELEELLDDLADLSVLSAGKAMNESASTR